MRRVLFGLGLVLALVAVVAACGGGEEATPVVIEKEVIKEVPVEKVVEVEKPVIVEKEVPVEVVKEVPVEVIKEVTKEVPVERVVVKEVKKVVEVEKPEKVYELRMNLVWSVTDSNAIAMNRFADLVEARTGGAVKITTFPRCTLLSCGDALKELSRGTVKIDADATVVSDEGITPAAVILGAPFIGLKGDLLHKLWVESAQFRDLVNQAYGKVNAKVLAVWNAGDIGLVSFDRIQSVDDFRGKIVRPSRSELAAKVLRSIGAEVALMSGSEAVDAMRRKIVDASGIQISSLQSRGYSDFANFWQPWPLFPITSRIAVNLEWWNELPEELQFVLEQTALDVSQELNATNSNIQGEFLAKNLVEDKLAFLPVKDSDIAELGAIAAPLVEEFAGDDEVLQGMLALVLEEAIKPLTIEPPSAKEVLIAEPTKVLTATPAEVQDLRMNAIWGVTDSNTIFTKRFADLVKERTNGAIKIQVFPSCTLLKCNQAAKELGRGTVKIDADASLVSDESVVPAAQLLEPPFLGLTGTDVHELWKENARFRELLDEAYARANVKVLSWWNAGDVGLVSFDPITTVDDFRGKIVRPSSNVLAGEALKATGAEVALMSGSEAVAAMRQGIVDASAIQASSIISRGYHDFAGFWQPWPLFPLNARIAVNLDWWNEQPQEIRDILQETAQQVANAANALNDSIQGAFMLKNLIENKMTFLPVADSEIERMRQIAEPAIRAFANGNEPAALLNELLDIVLQKTAE